MNEYKTNHQIETSKTTIIYELIFVLELQFHVQFLYFGPIFASELAITSHIVDFESI